MAIKTYHTYTMQYSDADASRHIRLSDLERYLLEAAGASADILGFGTNYILEKYNAAWVLTRLSVMMDYLPEYLDEIEIETWVEGNAHMLSMRNFRLYLKKGSEKQLIGQAASVWTLLNMETRQVDLAAFADSAWEGKIDGERLDIPRAPRLNKLDEPTGVMPHTIHYSDLDYNGHCNSCKYTQFMLNSCDALTATWPIRMDINYAKEVHKGEAISVTWLQTDDSIRYCILTETGDISCTGMLSRYTVE